MERAPLIFFDVSSDARELSGSRGVEMPSKDLKIFADVCKVMILPGEQPPDREMYRRRRGTVF